MSMPWPAWTETEWREKLGMRAAEEIGHEFHGNQWTGSAGKQAEQAFKNAGLQVITARDVPLSVRDQLHMSKHDTGRDATDSHAVGAQAVVTAFNELKGGPTITALRDEIKNHAQVALVGYEPKSATMTAVTGGGSGQLMLLINTNYASKPDLEGFAHAGIESKKVRDAGGSKEDAISTEYRLSALHEFGHFYDRMSGKRASSDLVDTLVAKIPGASDPKGHALIDWVSKHISPYAATNPRDLFAEAFTLALEHKLPKELEDWGKKIRD